MADALVPPPYRNNTDAPFVYFDIVGPYGTMNGAIQIELAARTLSPVAGTENVSVEMLTTARLRCSPTAAALLRDSIDLALKLLEQANQPPGGVAQKLN